MIKHRRYAWFVAATLLALSSEWLGFSAGRSNLPLPPAAAIESINVGDLRQHEEFLASDELGGRYTLSPSNAIVARYLASRLRNYGFRGGAEDGSFFQKFELVAQLSNPDASFIESEEQGTPVQFQLGKDFVLHPPLGETDIRGELVLVPSTLLTASSNNDLDLKGKIAVVPVEANTTASPSAPSNHNRIAERSQARAVKDVVHQARERSAAGVILLLRGRTEGPRSPESPRPQSMSGGRLVFSDEKSGQPAFPVVQAYDSLIEWIFARSQIDPHEVYSPSVVTGIRPLGKQVRIKTSVQGPKRVTQNVIGILDGGDPQLKREYVMFSAHLDHLESVGTTIFHGADDDASGTSAVLEIAQAFALGPRPRRSILVVFHTGEEEGLLGSKYFVEHPTVPLPSIVVDLNVDMIGRTRAPGDTNPADNELSDANTLYLIGSDKLSQELHQLSEQTNQDTVRMNLDYRYNSPDHPYRLYYRSDHWNYAKNGIPVIFYFTGLHQDYHQPTDVVEKLDFEKMARITRLIFATGWRIANLDHRLKLNPQSQ